MKNKQNKAASEIRRKVGRPCLFDRPMTSTERWRRWKDKGRVRLWEGEDGYDEELREWSERALRSALPANVVRLADRRR